MRIIYNDDGKFGEWTEQIWDTDKGVWQAQVADIGTDGDWDILNCDYGANIGQYEYWENKTDPVPVNGPALGPRVSHKSAEYCMTAGGRIRLLSPQAIALDARGRELAVTRDGLLRSAASGIVIVADTHSGLDAVVLAQTAR
jgi:hypothetical protein